MRCRASDLVLCAALVAVASACQRSAPSPRRRGPLTVLTGRVRLAEGAMLPAYAALDLGHRALRAEARADIPRECAAANARALSPVTRTADGLLSNIVIAASDFTHLQERKPVTHRVAISQCGLRPSTISAMSGDRLLIENRDAFGFEPLLGPALSGKRLARGERMLHALEYGVESIACSPNAPCGRTDVVVLYHPVSAVTGADGTFRIADFPARESVRLTAWHPLFEDSETFVWLEPSQQGMVELVLSPKPRFTAAARPAK